MERIRFVSGSRMSRGHIVSAHDAQTRSREILEQACAGPQTQMLRQIGKDQPPLTSWREMPWQRLQKSAQHLAVGIVDSIFHGRARPRGNPLRISDHERRATVGKKVRQHDIDAFAEPQLSNVVTRTRQRARLQIGRDHAFDATTCQYHGEHTGARANVEGNAFRSARHWQWRRSDEVHVLTADRREDTEVRINCPACFRKVDAPRSPLVRTDGARGNGIE